MACLCARLTSSHWERELSASNKIQIMLAALTKSDIYIYSEPREDDVKTMWSRCYKLLWLWDPGIHCAACQIPPSPGTQLEQLKIAGLVYRVVRSWLLIVALKCGTAMNWLKKKIKTKGRMSSLRLRVLKTDNCVFPFFSSYNNSTTERKRQEMTALFSRQRTLSHS
jgi:hypothetical protein